jgi:hypothetical protein
MNSKSTRFAYLVKDWGENHPPKQDYIKRLASFKLPVKDTTKAVIWQIYGERYDLYFKAFCYSILSYVTHSNILSYDILVYLSPCFLEYHRSLIEALEKLGVKFIPVKEIYRSKYYVLFNFPYDYEKIMLIDCDTFLTSKIDFDEYWETTYALAGDKMSKEQQKWAVWPKLIEVKTGMAPEHYLEMVYEHFSKLYTKEEFDEATNYIGDFMSGAHWVLDKSLYKNKDFIDFLQWSSINKFESDEITVQLGARLVKAVLGYNNILTVNNYEANNPSIHLNGLTFDKHPELASVFHKLL